MDVPISKELRRFNYLLGETDGVYHDAAVRMGLSDSVMRILYCLCCEGDPCPLRTIVRQSGMSKQTVNSALRKLEGAGAVYLEAAGGRSKNVCLTDAGRELAGRTAAPLMELEDEIFSAWGADEVEQYIRLTQRYLEDFREKSARFQTQKGRGRGKAPGPGG